ncbi:trypsin-like peptidase domain-containing protein [Saccharothrix luteola]|uniref:trypsin-like peptidase domain-containing protein n=1 Tax=Saccharothrix luteola TaxID=2893018 RepID=UPI001E49E247|nr:trypsin-like peptidase domain-containing protein [Saccharothrix luteola]MCC8245382.1 serine protease [Saccharothrix luteola]
MGDIGAGVLVAPELVLTCSHVVPHDRVDVTLVHPGVAVAASVEFREDDGDLAVLRLDRPVDAVCAPLRAPSALSDHPYVVQGFAGGHHTESRGRLGGRVGPGWVQLEHTSGHLTPWAPPWPGVAGPSTKAATALRDGRAFVATGDDGGRPAVWSCPPGGRARTLAALDLDSPVTDLIRHPDGTLVVWCRSGVLKLDFG